MNTFKMVKETFDELYGPLPIPIFLFDEKTRLVNANQSFLDLARIDKHMIPTLTISFFLKDPGKCFDGNMVFKSVPQRKMTNLIRSDGEAIPIEHNHKKLKGEDGSFKGCLVFIADLLEVTSSKKELKKLKVDLEILKEELVGETSDKLIKERKKLEQEVKETKEFLENVVESCGDGIVIIDSAARIIRVNKSFAKILGKEKEEITGQMIYEIGPTQGTFKLTADETINLDESFQIYLSEQLEKLLDLKGCGKIENIEYYAFNSRGEVVPLELTASLLRDHNGVVTGAVCVFRDITKKRIAEKEIRESKDFLENIFKTNADGIMTCNPEGFITMVNDSAAHMLGYSREELIGIHAKKLGPEGAEYKENVMKYLGKLHEDSFFTIFEYPLVKKDGSLVDTEMNATLLKDNEGNITEVLSNIRDITERKKSEEALKLSEERYYTLIEHANDAIISANEEGVITNVNKKAEEMYGYSREELLGKSALLLVAPVDRKQQEQFLDNFKNHKKYSIVKKPIEGKHVRKDGKEFPVESSFSSSIVYGKHSFTAFVRDITERKRAEDELRETKEQFENLFEYSLDPITICDGQGKIIKANKAFLKLLGYSEEEVLGEPTHNFAVTQEGIYETTTGELVTIGKDFSNESEEKITQLGEKGMVSNWVTYYLNKENKIIPINQSIIFLYNDKGKRVASFSIKRDITERKIAEKEIRESKDFLENIFKTTADGIMVTDNDGYITRINKAVEKITGYREDELLGKHIMELLPQNDEHLKKSAAMIEELYEKGYVENWEDEWQRKDGTLCPFECNVTFLKDLEGNPFGSVGSVRDITERKKAEKTIQEANQFRKQFFTNITHEFRTPLTLAMGPIEGILRGECGKIHGSLKKQLSLSLQNSRKLLKLINQLLEFSKL